VRPARGAKFGDKRWFPVPEFRSKPRPQLPNRHHPAVDADPKPYIRFGALSYLADENDMTGTLQFLNPRRDTWAGGPQRIFVSRSNKKTRWGAGFSASGPWSRDTPSIAIPEVLLGAHQQWTVAGLMARRAKTPPPRRERMLKCARAMAHLVSWQWTHPDDSQMAKTPCPPETLTEMGFSPAMVAALTRGPPPLV
jgi:hypothetical protein